MHSRYPDIQVVNCVIWVQQSAQLMDGQPAIDDSLSLPLFVSSYMQIMEAEKPATKALMATHLMELMGNMEL